MKITFVCLGNICRSPMAEYLAKNYIKINNIKNVEIDSCGTANYHEGEFMHKGTDKILSSAGIYHSDFISKSITKKIFDESDYIVVMDNSNYKNVIRMFGENKKIVKMTDYCDLNYSEVPDPYYSENFEETYKILENSINSFFKKLNS